MQMSWLVAAQCRVRIRLHPSHPAAGPAPLGASGEESLTHVQTIQQNTVYISTSASYQGPVNTSGLALFVIMSLNFA